MALATRTAIKNMLGVPSVMTKHDDVIDMLIDVSDQIVLDDLRLSSFDVTTYSEKLSVDTNYYNIGVTKMPATSIVALTVSGTAWVEDTNFNFDVENGYIEAIGSSTFKTGKKVVEVTYNAGFDTVPSNLVYASNLIACSLFNQQSHVGLSKEKAGDYEYNMDGGTGSTRPAAANRILNKYRTLFARGLK